MAAHATAAELTDWLPSSTPEVDDAERLLVRASEVVDATVTVAYDVDADTTLATDETLAGALRDATCAQVEFWLEVGEEHDVIGLGGTGGGQGGGIRIGALSLSQLPPVLAPRAQRILATGGLLGSAVGGPAGVLVDSRGEPSFVGWP